MTYLEDEWSESFNQSHDLSQKTRLSQDNSPSYLQFHSSTIKEYILILFAYNHIGVSVWLPYVNLFETQ